MDAIALMSSVRSQCDANKTATSQFDELEIEVRSSCVLVVENEKLIGIMTERDVVHLSAAQQSLDLLVMQEVMNSPVITLKEDAFTDLFSTINLLQQQNIRHLAIVDREDHLVGLVTHESLRQTSQPIDLMRLRLVSEVMTSKVICAAPDDSMLVIAKLMSSHRVSSVMIVQTSSSDAEYLQIPVGILTERDIVQFQALGLNLTDWNAESMMSSPIFSVKSLDSLWLVHQMLEQHFIRRLAVTGEQGELLGIVTQTSLLNALNPVELYNLANVLEQKVLQLEAEKVALLENRNVELEKQVEARTIALKAKADREKLLSEIALQIRSSLSLQTILDESVAQVRQLLNCDRANIWQLEAAWQAIVVAESTTSAFSLLGERVDDTCFNQDWAESYRQGKIRVVPDIYEEEVETCHREMSIRIHTHAKILVPIICGDKLWGMLNVSESQYARFWKVEEIELLQDIAIQMAIAIQQSTAYQQLQNELAERLKKEEQLKHTQKLFQEAQRLASIGNWEFDILKSQIYWSDEIYRIFEIDPQQFTVSYETFLNGIHPEDRQQVDDIYQKSLPDRPAYSSIYRLLMQDGRIKYLQDQGEISFDEQGAPIRSQGTVQDITQIKLAELQLQELNQDLERQVADRTAVSLALSNRLSLALQAGEIGTWDWDLLNEVKWDKGMMELYEFYDLDHSATYDDWISRVHPDDREATERCLQAAVKGEKDYNIEFRIINSVGRLRWIYAIAIAMYNEQGKIYRIIGINQDITERKQLLIQQEQKAKQESLLRKITQRIRQSLNLQIIFDTACQEIHEALQTDRVGIFQFHPESHYDDGEFVAESIVEGFPSVLEIRVHDHCLGGNYAASYAQGRYQAVDDIYQAGLSQCHIDILAQFQIRANLIVPLLCGEDLWGLLCIHQCDAPRHWQKSELELSQQIANQLAIAIVQANLYQQAQSELAIRQQTEVLLSQQLRQQETIRKITQRVRESLDVNEILAIVTEKVKDLLDCDRAIVFRLFADGRSRIVEEAVSSEFAVLKDMHWENEVWSQETLDCYWQGNPRIVPDVMDDIWASCLVEYSAKGQIQSKIVAPILQDLEAPANNRWISPTDGNRLWGVLVVYACAEKRVWLQSEADLLQLIANQLAIAIQQASLFEQVKQELSDRQLAEQQLIKANQQLVFSNEELERATRLKDEFLANMSHELRTPLNAILGITEGLQEEVFGILNDKQQKVLLTIESSGNHLLQLINDVLDLAKIEAGKLELDCDLTHIEQLSQSSVMFVRQMAMQKNVKLTTNIAPILPKLTIDERRIRQVLINLLNNAVKFTLEGGSITLEITLQKAIATEKNYNITHWVKFAVIDTGIGIAPDALKTLFQPFIQVDSALNRQYDGTGLGLALVKRIVELHGGRVSATSEVGVGSCFALELPYNEMDVPLPKQLVDNFTSIASNSFVGNSNSANSSYLVLLAEDNEANIISVSSYLDAKGYRVILAKNGREAVDLVLSQQPDLVLMDIQMPEIDGLTAIAIIRSHKLTVPIIALTALAMTGDREKCLAAGADDYLSKPIKLRQLATVVDQFLTAAR
jgi:GAF domain-containing protein/CBS domain-containing protein/anti-sigma regulatory factor (Ser/Thr protein kinase)